MKMTRMIGNIGLIALGVAMVERQAFFWIKARHNPNSHLDNYRNILPQNMISLTSTEFEGGD